MAAEIKKIWDFDRDWKFRARMKFSSEPPLAALCGEIETSRLKISSEIENFDRVENFDRDWSFLIVGHPDKPPRPSHPRGLDFGPFRLRLAPFGSVWLRLAPFRVCSGSVSGPFGGCWVGSVRGAFVREKNITTSGSVDGRRDCKNREAFDQSRFSRIFECGICPKLGNFLAWETAPGRDGSDCDRGWPAAE